MSKPTDGRRIRAVALPPEYLEEGAKLMAKKRADKLDPLTEAEEAQLPRDAAKIEAYGRRDIADLYRRVIAERVAMEESIANLKHDRKTVIEQRITEAHRHCEVLAERKADKAEVKRLEHVVRYAGIMLAECVEYKRQGRCKDAMVNVLLRRARIAAEAAGGDDD